MPLEQNLALGKGGSIECTLTNSETSGRPPSIQISVCDFAVVQVNVLSELYFYYDSL